MRFFIILAFLAGTQMYGQIVAGANASCGNPSSQPTCPAASTINLHPDDIIILAAYPGTGNITFAAACGITWTKQGNSTTDNVGIWEGITTTGGTGCQITTQISPNASVVWAAQIYSGVASVGAFTNSTALGSSGTSTCSFATTLANAGDFSVTVFKRNIGTDTFSATAGTLRLQSTMAGHGLAFIDQYAAAPGPLTSTVSFAPATGFCATAVSVPLIAGPVSATSAYYGTPPLVAGTGITITPSQTAITIAATGSPAGGSPIKVAGGAYSLASENFAANTCVLRPAGGISAPGTVHTDVVVMSRDSNGSGWAQGRLRIEGEAFAGTISIEICNPESAPINPGALPLPLNWMVLR